MAGPTRRLLVTGCAGFIGSSLVATALARGHEVHGIDAFSSYYPRGQKERNLAPLLGRPGFRFSEIDLATADLRPLVAEVEVVIHLAGQPGVRASWGDGFVDYTRDNVLATQRLLEAAVGLPLHRFVYASSSSVYGRGARGPTREDQPPRPFSPYGVSKLAGEHLGVVYLDNFGVPYVGLRYFTVYGPGQRPDMGIHKFARAALLGQPISVFGDGEQSRDVTYVQDAVDATLAAAERGRVGAVYNVGGGARVTVNQLLRAIEAAVGRPLDRRHLPPQPGDVDHTWADTSAARADLGYAPTTDPVEGVRAEVEWLRGLLESTGELPASPRVT